MENKEKFQSVTGIVNEINIKDTTSPIVITVRYTVNSGVHRITENVRIKSFPVKLGRLTVGQKKAPAIENITVGKELTVCYNPLNPAEAYIKENSEE